MLDQQNQKHDSKKSELWKMSMSFTKSIIMPTKVIDTDGELNEAKKKKFDHKQFELVDKSDKESKLDKQRKNFIKEIKEQEKGVDKKGFSRYFIYEPSALVSKLLDQNTQDLENSLDETKQQKIELNKD